MSIPVDEGTILKTEITENNTTVTTTTAAVQPGEPEASFFQKPAFYTGPDFPER